MVPAGLGIMLPASTPWTVIEFAYVFVMWAVMMVGMMAPSAAPMILMYALVGRQGKVEGKPFAATGRGGSPPTSPSCRSCCSTSQPRRSDRPAKTATQTREFDDGRA